MPLPTRASLRPTGTTRLSTAAAGHSTPRSPSCRIPPSAPNPLGTRTSPGLIRQTGIPACSTGRPRFRVAGADGHRFGHAAGGQTGTGARRHRTDPAASGRRPDVAGTDGFLGQAGHLSLGRPAVARSGAARRRAGHRAGVLARGGRHRHDFGRRTRSAGCDRRRCQGSRRGAAAQLGAAPQLGPAGRLGRVRRAGARQRAESTAARTGSSRCDCWRSSSSPRSSAARWCCCLSNVLARRFTAVGEGRVAVLGRGGYLRFGTNGIDGP